MLMFVRFCFYLQGFGSCGAQPTILQGLRLSGKSIGIRLKLHEVLHNHIGGC